MRSYEIWKNSSNLRCAFMQKRMQDQTPVLEVPSNNSWNYTTLEKWNIG